MSKRDSIEPGNKNDNWQNEACIYVLCIMYCSLCVWMATFQIALGVWMGGHIAG